MGAYEGLVKYFDNDVINKAHKLGYGEFLISVLKGDEETLEQKYNSVWNVVKSDKYHIEDRTAIDFARDMVTTWMFEDCVLGTLINNGIDISYGKDFNNRKKFTNRPDKLDYDIVIHTDNRDLSLLIRCDYTNSWTKTKTLVLRPSQYKKLKNKKMILLGFSPEDNKLILLNHLSIQEAKYIESYKPYNGKPVYSINIPNTVIYTYSAPTMIEEIRKYCLYK